MSTPTQHTTLLNPYATFLEHEQPLEILKSTPQKITALLTHLSPPVLIRPPAPGKWSIRHIVCHLADTEMVFGFRLRQTVAEDHHVIQPYDQEKHAVAYDTITAQEALDAFAAFRHWNLCFIQAVIPQALAKPVTHPERGTMTFATILETMAGHDNNHLQQILRLKKL